MKYQFMKDHSTEYSIKKMARVFKVSRSCYYAWLNREPCDRERQELELLFEIKRIYFKFRKTYGSPRIYNELKDEGICCSENRVARIMRKNGIAAERKRRFKVTTDSKHDYPASPNLLNREFDVEEPNTCWVGDITYIWTDEGWLYLAIVMDLFSRMIVGWAMESHMKSELVIDALNMAVKHRSPDEGTLFHSDKGIQYASTDFRECLSGNKMVQSMSRKGNCWDNACAESFFATLKMEEVFLKKYKTREEARQSIFEYIEIFYNRMRSHSKLDFQSPAKYESMWLQKVA